MASSSAGNPSDGFNATRVIRDLELHSLLEESPVTDIGVRNAPSSAVEQETDQDAIEDPIGDGLLIKTWPLQQPEEDQEEPGGEVLHATSKEYRNVIRVLKAGDVPEARLIQDYEKLCNGNLPKKIQDMYEKNLQERYLSLRRQELLKYRLGARDNLMKEAKDARKAQVKTTDLVQSVFREGCKSTGLANNLLRGQGATNMALRSILSNANELEGHCSSLEKMHEQFSRPDVGEDEKQRIIQDVGRHAAALVSGVKAQPQLFAKLVDMTETDSVKGDIQSQRKFHFGHVDDDQDENISPFILSDIPIIKLLQERARTEFGASTSTKTKENQDCANCIWDGKAFVFVDERQVRPDSCITATNLAFKDYHLVVVPKSLMEKFPIDKVHLSNLADIVTLESRRRSFPLEHKSPLVTVDDTLSMLRKIYYKKQERKDPVIREIREISTELHPATKRLVNWNLIILRKQHDIAPPFLNVWKENDMVARHWLNCSTYYRDVGMHDFCNTEGDKGLGKLRFGEWPPQSTRTDAKKKPWSEISGSAADDLQQMGDVVKFWLDNVELEDLQDEQGNILFREDVMRAKREARAKLLRDIDERQLRIYKQEYQARSEAIIHSNDTIEGNLKGNSHFLSVKYNLEITEMHNHIWIALDNAKKAQTYENQMKLLDALTWYTRKATYTRARANFDCALLQFQAEKEIARKLELQPTLARYHDKIKTEASQWDVYSKLRPGERPIDWNAWEVVFVALNCFDENIGFAELVGKHNKHISLQLDRWNKGHRHLDYQAPAMAELSSKDNRAIDQGLEEFRRVWRVEPNWCTVNSESDMAEVVSHYKSPPVDIPMEDVLDLGKIHQGYLTSRRADPTIQKPKLLSDIESASKEWLDVWDTAVDNSNMAGHLAHGLWEKESGKKKRTHDEAFAGDENKDNGSTTDWMNMGTFESMSIDDDGESAP